MVDLTKVAAVLDAAANHLDAIENEKASSVRVERQVQIDALAAKYAEVTGEEMPDSMRQKLAASDKDIVALVNAMVEKQAGHIETLGKGSDKSDDKIPTTTKEATEQADQRFLNWIVSS